MHIRRKFYFFKKLYPPNGLLMIVEKSRVIQETEIYDKVLDLFLKYLKECENTLTSKKIDVIKLINFLQSSNNYSSAVEKMRIIQNTLVLLQALFDDKYPDYFHCIGKDTSCLTHHEREVLKREIIKILSY